MAFMYIILQIEIKIFIKKAKMDIKNTIITILVVSGICFSQSELNQAIELVNTSRYDEAENLVDTYLLDHKDDHRANFIKAVILIHNTHNSKALRFIEKAIVLKNDIASYYQIAGLLYEEFNKSKLAIQAWEKCHEYAKDTRLFVESKNHLTYLKNK